MQKFAILFKSAKCFLMLEIDQMITYKNSITAKTTWLFLIILAELVVLTPMVQAALPIPPVPGTKLDISIDVGYIYFPGENAEFYILVSLNGRLHSGLLDQSR